MTSDLKRIEKHGFFLYFRKKSYFNTLTIYRAIDYFRDLKTCTDPEIFSKGEGWSPRHIFGNLIRKILRKIFRGGGGVSGCTRSPLDPGMKENN